MNDNDEIVNNAHAEDNGKLSLNPKGTPPGEDKLMAYLEGKLLPEEQHEIEKWLAEDGMESDAIEGLRSQPASDTKNTIRKLNYSLERTLKNKKRKKNTAKPDQTVLIAVAIILLLSVAAYMVIKYASHK